VSRIEMRGELYYSHKTSFFRNSTSPTFSHVNSLKFLHILYFKVIRTVQFHSREYMLKKARLTICECWFLRKKIVCFTVSTPPFSFFSQRSLFLFSIFLFYSLLIPCSPISKLLINPLILSEETSKLIYKKTMEKLP